RGPQSPFLHGHLDERRLDHDAIRFVSAGDRHGLLRVRVVLEKQPFVDRHDPAAVGCEEHDGTVLQSVGDDHLHKALTHKELRDRPARYCTQPDGPEGYSKPEQRYERYEGKLERRKASLAVRLAAGRFAYPNCRKAIHKICG